MKKRFLASATAATLLVGAAVIPSVASAEVATKNLQARYNNIKIFYNGYQVSTDIEPFIVNGTTYIPLRMMANVFNKNVEWDGTTYTIRVTDRPDAATQAQLAAKDAEIKRLQSRIATLEDQLASKSKSSKKSKDGDIDDLEDDLWDEFEDYFEDDYDIVFDDISVSGDEDKVKVIFELEGDEYDWDDIDEDDIEDFVIDVVEFIWDWDEFEDADVDGKVIDIDDDDEVLIKFKGDADDEEILLDGKVIND